MHISEGVLSAPVLITGAALTAAAVGIGLKNGKLELDENKLQEAMEDHFDEVVEFFSEVESGMAPLMKKLLADYAATGLPFAYLPKDEDNFEDPESLVEVVR